jgi:RND family efflux transporter MFP subunit
MIAASCSRDRRQDTVSADTPSAIQVREENIVRVQEGQLVTGPLISGELQAEHSATVRAEVGGTVVDLRIEEGQRVERGSLLGRIDAQALEDSRNLARAVVRSTEAVVDSARIEVRRYEELVAAGVVARRSLDQSRIELANAEAQLANVRAALVTAEDQLSDTMLRAPISGVVSRRNVAAGEVVAVGTELFTVIDPRSMRLDASVSPEHVTQLRVGIPVRFTITGFEKDLQGRLERISPEADPVTRQVTIYVMIPNISGRLVAGLFAEGRVVTATAKGPVVPIDAVNFDDERTWVLRVQDGRAERVNVKVGLRDDLTERAIIASGVTAGDVLLRGTDQAITPGTPVDLTQ